LIIAWEQYKVSEERRGKESREETAHKVTWGAVKHRYKKGRSGKWEEKIIN